MAEPRKESGILFAAAMVQAIDRGQKTQTRRPVTSLLGFGVVSEFGPSDTAGYDWHFRDKHMRWHDISHERLMQACPYGAPGDRLWVRETWAYHGGDEYLYQRIRDNVAYRAGGSGPLIVEGLDPIPGGRWRSPRFMPRWASRFDLEIEEVRCQRLQDITERDAIAEGMGSPITRDCKVPKFAELWDKINGVGSWSANGWIWAVSFRRVAGEGIR